MKKGSFLIALIFVVFTSFAQWQNGTNIYNTNSGNVGIGLTNPAEKLHVAGNLKLTGANGDAGSNTIEWYTSSWGSGFGHKIYSIDPGGSTHLRIAARHNSGTWTDVATFTSDGNVGIGTNAPGFTLDVNGIGRVRAGAGINANLIFQGGVGPGTAYQAYWLTGANGIFKIGGNGGIEPSQGAINIDYTGKVGIGLTPAFPFDVNAATTRFGTPSVTNNNIIIQGGAGTYNAFWVTAADYTLKIGGVGGSEPSSGAINIDYTGSVAIGTTNSNGYKLAVNGNSSFTSVTVGTGVLSTPAGYNMYVSGGILTEKIKAALPSSTNWSDFVFDKKYQLRPLKEVEAYIGEHKHLPGMPSGDDLVKEGGIDMNEMFARQMEKIEELTLYIIEQNKQIESLKEQLANLQKNR